MPTLMTMRLAISIFLIIFIPVLIQIALSNVDTLSGRKFCQMFTP